MNSKKMMDFVDDLEKQGIKPRFGYLKSVRTVDKKGNIGIGFVRPSIKDVIIEKICNFFEKSSYDK